jgi:hypothetical protein
MVNGAGVESLTQQKNLAARIFPIAVAQTPQPMPPHTSDRRFFCWSLHTAICCLEDATSLRSHAFFEERKFFDEPSARGAGRHVG